MTELEDRLRSWTGHSSATEQDKQDRTERMIREAIEAHEPFRGMSRRVYAKGSYANNTNVRSDSDVDVAVECTDVLYWEEATPGAHPPGTRYSGPWTPAKLRSELVAALRAKFGDAVDTSGTTAIQIHSTTARVEADVVPCFEYRYYFSETSFREGAKVFKADGSSLVNYSAQQLANGRRKNNQTSRAFKRTVRILKRLENVMTDAGFHREVPSFFVECLVYNCPDALFSAPTWTETVKGVLAHIYLSLEGPEPSEEEDRWVEVNGIKFLFHAAQKWTRQDGREFAEAGWKYLGLEGA